MPRPTGAELWRREYNEAPKAQLLKRLEGGKLGCGFPLQPNMDLGSVVSASERGTGGAPAASEIQALLGNIAYTF